MQTCRDSTPPRRNKEPARHSSLFHDATTPSAVCNGKAPSPSGVPMRRFRPLRALAVILPLFATTSQADDWPQFRGPGGTGVAAGDLPAEWSADKNVTWKVNLD